MTGSDLDVCCYYRVYRFVCVLYRIMKLVAISVSRTVM